jgi:uncharacterized protein YtpQ (UPF0354 family)
MSDNQGVTIWPAHTRFPRVQVTSTRFLPLLVSTRERVDQAHLLEDLTDSIAVAYSFGPPYGQRLVTWSDLDRMRTNRRTLRRMALDHLYGNLDHVQIHGQPPALMLSFDGLESSVLLADEFWDQMERSVPGDLVVGVPARDVVIITGSDSRPGMEKARRAVERVFFAGDRHLLSRDLLVWRQGEWWPMHRPAQPAPPPPPPQVSYRPPRPRQSPERHSAERHSLERHSADWHSPQGSGTRRPSGPLR